MAFQKPDQQFFTAQRVNKPWGHERLWAWTDDYVGKLLHVKAGESLSLQYHERKDETIALLSGRVELEHGDDECALSSRMLEPGDCFRVTPGTRHRLTAIEDSDLLEASTPDLDDVVRLEDRYGREGTSEA
jgi:mannose-6-phosphate isomerase-like protein (cupin superfamily)